MNSLRWDTDTFYVSLLLPRRVWIIYSQNAQAISLIANKTQNSPIHFVVADGVSEDGLLVFHLDDIFGVQFKFCNEKRRRNMKNHSESKFYESLIKTTPEPAVTTRPFILHYFIRSFFREWKPSTMSRMSHCLWNKTAHSSKQTINVNVCPLSCCCTMKSFTQIHARELIILRRIIWRRKKNGKSDAWNGVSYFCWLNSMGSTRNRSISLFYQLWTIHSPRRTEKKCRENSQMKGLIFELVWVETVKTST
jgi:hypothetical protein